MYIFLLYNRIFLMIFFNFVYILCKNWYGSNTLRKSKDLIFAVMHICIYAYAYACMCVCVYVYMYAYLCMCVCVYVTIHAM